MKASHIYTTHESPFPFHIFWNIYKLISHVLIDHAFFQDKNILLKWSKRAFEEPYKEMRITIYFLKPETAFILVNFMEKRRNKYLVNCKLDMYLPSC
jgi:hypothetical protein